MHLHASFAHHRLDAFRVAMDLVEGTHHFAGSLPRGNAVLRDQLVRSAMSIVRQVAEATGRTSPADRRARFVVARGECGELDASLEIAWRLGIGSRREVERLRTLANRVGAMLTGLVRKETKRVRRRE